MAELKKQATSPKKGSAKTPSKSANSRKSAPKADKPATEKKAKSTKPAIAKKVAPAKAKPALEEVKKAVAPQETEVKENVLEEIEPPLADGQASVEVETLESPSEEKKDVILSVRHLKQYFKLGGSGAFKYNKAVHDVSFDVYRGEVFGLVGESGCGKTTIGRTIIRLYQPTSGDVYFKGVRIGAGTRWNEKEIKFTRLRLKKKLKELHEQEEAEISALPEGASEAEKAAIQTKYRTIAAEETDKANVIVEREKKNIAKAHNDMKRVDKDFAADAVRKVKAKYADLLARTNNLRHVGPEDKELAETYRDELRVAKHSRITGGMQMIFQDPMASINPRMTVRGIISEGLRINGVHNGKYIKKRVDEMLEKVGLLPEHADRYPHEFSGGQRQRIGIARALIMNPELIIADEPVSALDVSIQAQIINLLNDLRDELGLTILFIAHNLSVVKYFCDRIAVMYFGNLVELASSDELFRHPFHPYTRSLLSAVPHCDPDTEKNRVRLKYDPKSEHDYSEDKPRLVEIEPGHFVLCNKVEERKYRSWLAKGYDSGYGR